ncbi:CWC16 protein [Massariosphaeria phaeospora]|uniref:CWC16 protein n=1 Tax=Massariosphaeria phaeospora TaxID=100035 RepID=A0A7C8I408_9PLEO|nr:CWC16 protein [Massariosphaeria phaeospora]
MQGFNMGRYYPPDAENAPRFNNSHPFGNRAKSINQGILTVRFELPFAVWCDHCKPTAIVGQGVRFNAEKKKVGNYYSTPIWSFRMKHTACGGWWEIRTDPQNTEYVVVEGARKRDYGPEEKAEGELAFLTEEEKERRRKDAFANFEGKAAEKGLEKKNKERVEDLYDVAEVWRDPYEVNARLRRDFRVRRKVLEKEERHKEGMQDKFSLGLDIADEIETDRIRAGLVEFGATAGDWKLDEASRKPLFVTMDVNKAIESSAPKKKRLKAEIRAEKNRLNLQQTLIGNTRAAMDPFLAKTTATTSKLDLGILNRKRKAHSVAGSGTCTPDSAPAPPKRLAVAAPLVDYGSD